MKYTVEQLEQKRRYCRECIEQMERHRLAGKNQIFLGFPERIKEYQGLSDIYQEMENVITRNAQLVGRVALLEDLVDRCRSVSYLPKALMDEIETVQIPKS